MKQLKSYILATMFICALGITGTASANEDTEAQAIYFMPVDLGCSD